jgi:hypothetical protein
VSRNARTRDVFRYVSQTLTNWTNADFDFQCSFSSSVKAKAGEDLAVAVSKVEPKDLALSVDQQATIGRILTETIWANCMSCDTMIVDAISSFRHKGSSFRGAATGFLAGAAGGVAAYSLMRGMSGGYGYRPGYYEPGYGGERIAVDDDSLNVHFSVGDTCYNSEDFNGTTFGSFRCPLNGFPYEARYCCGEPGKQFCCIRESQRYVMRSLCRNSFKTDSHCRSGFHGTSNFMWIILLIIVILLIALIWARYQRNRQSRSICSYVRLSHRLSRRSDYGTE